MKDCKFAFAAGILLGLACPWILLEFLRLVAG
jgi:hypothetical protein